MDSNMAAHQGYYGIYRARIATATAGLASTKRDNSMFPPAITFNKLTYTLDRVMQVSTASQEKAFRKYCADNNLDTDVNF